LASEQGVRAASTVALVRVEGGGDSGAGEILMLHRPESMRAFGGFHVFPGGALDSQDCDPAAFAVSALSEQEAAARLGEAAGDHPALGFFVCALRELFEEVGVLLARDSAGPVTLDGAALRRARRELAGGKSFPEVVDRLGLQLATDLLRFHTRWIAPAILPVRFDVRVFVATASGDPHPDPGEVQRLDWYTPSAAMALSEAGAIMLAPPTVATLSSLARYAGAAEMISGELASSGPPEIERLSPLVARIVAPNASLMTGPGTNTYLVGSPSSGEMIVIDPGSMEKSHLDAIAAAGVIATIVITHGHPDHFGGVIELAETTKSQIVMSGASGRASFFGDLVRTVGDGDTVASKEVELKVIATPGHASDHICLWLEEERALFSGDLVLGEGTTVISPPDGNLTDYLASLERVKALAPNRIYPGHFPPRDDPGEWIDYYINHRREREAQILAALEGGAATVGEIVSGVYASYPEALHPIAERTVLAHLMKLGDEGRVESAGDRYRVIER
jgi:glyoxylase-like metal-dependent hydrolase (beta-lactamase superfamily II)/8-oxo-dGTP pyrophosphatase MutT (NUDIX family)